MDGIKVSLHKLLMLLLLLLLLSWLLWLLLLQKQTILIQNILYIAVHPHTNASISVEKAFFENYHKRGENTFIEKNSIYDEEIFTLASNPDDLEF